MHTVAKARLSLPEFKETAVWRALTRKQKNAVLLFLSLENKTAAVQVAYNTRSKKNAQILGNQVFKSPKVQAALVAYYGTDPLESFKADLLRAYTSGKISVAQIDAMKLFAKLNGWGSASLPNTHGRDVVHEPSTEEPEPVEPVAPTQTFVVGQRIEERDSDGVTHVGIIRSLTPDGQPDDVEEVL